VSGEGVREALQALMAGIDAARVADGRGDEGKDAQAAWQP